MEVQSANFHGGGHFIWSSRENRSWNHGTFWCPDRGDRSNHSILRDIPRLHRGNVRGKGLCNWPPGEVPCSVQLNSIHLDSKIEVTLSHTNRNLIVLSCKKASLILLRLRRKFNYNSIIFQPHPGPVIFKWLLTCYYFRDYQVKVTVSLPHFPLWTLQPLHVR